MQYFNPNPAGKAVGDCVIRAIAKATGDSWGKVYMDLAATGHELSDMPSANAVWGAYLRRRGFARSTLPDYDGYTVRQFAAEHPRGSYILALSGHVVAVVDGEYFDAGDSGNETPSYVWEEKR